MVNIILGILIVRWLWSHVDFNLIINESMSLDRSSIVLSVMLGMLLYLFYGLRMALLLDIKLMFSTQIVIMGFGLNACLPVRLGDVFKIFLTKQFFKIDLTKTSFATIIEKSLDLTVISFLALTFVFGNTKSYMGLSLLILVIVALYMNFKNTSIFKIRNQFLKYFISVIQLMLAKNKHKSILFCTVGIWGLTWLVFYIFFNMNMISGHTFTVLDAITLLIFTTLSLSIPSMPASIGLFESGIVYYLTQHFHFLAEKAVAYALVFHLLMVLPQIIFTVIILLINIFNSEKLWPNSNDI